VFAEALDAKDYDAVLRACAAVRTAFAPADAMLLLTATLQFCLLQQLGVNVGAGDAAVALPWLEAAALALLQAARAGDAAPADMRDFVRPRLQAVADDVLEALRELDGTGAAADAGKTVKILGQLRLF
jgi:hypothetical protein